MNYPIRNADEARDLVRGLDKHSEGWAGIKTQEVPVGAKRTEVWAICFSVAISHIVVPYCRRAHHARVAGLAVPKHVRAYALIDDDNLPHKSALDRVTFDALQVGDDILEVTELSPLMKLVTVKIVHQPTRAREGIYVGCEVGESGDGPTDFLPFPTSERAVSAAMEACISSARDAEIETGWTATGGDE